MTIVLKKLTANLMVEDVNRTIDFYRDVLGFEVLATVPESGQFGWALLKRDTLEMMVQSRESLGEELPILKEATIGYSGTFYIEVEDIEELQRRLLEKGVPLALEMRTSFYGAREFAMRDNNGYVFWFAEPVKEN